jgi:hypothetical protein
VPIIASVIATAPFTNSPVENINQTLLNIRQLSYRQLCIIAVIGNATQSHRYVLRNGQLIANSDGFDEEKLGVIGDISFLVSIGLMSVSSTANIGGSSIIASAKPRYMRLHYAGLLIYNAGNLALIESADLEKIECLLVRAVQNN